MRLFLLPRVHHITCVDLLSLGLLFLGGFSYTMLTLFIVLILSRTIHSQVHIHSLPVSTVLPWYFTITPIFVKRTLHPTLHRTTSDVKECVLSPWMTCPILQALEKDGMSRRPLWVD